MPDAPAAPAPPAIRQDALRRLLAVARALGASDDLRRILSVIIDAARDVLGADRATVFEFDAAREELFTTVAHGLAGSGGPPEIRIPTSVGIAGECARTRAVINVPDAYEDARFNGAVDRATGYRTRSILTIPMVADSGELSGVMQVLNKSLDAGGRFTADDEEIALALAAQAAVALRRARLLEDRLVREKLEQELDLARRMQQQSFPQRLPALPGFDLAGFSEPAEQTGGDAYDLMGLRLRGGAHTVTTGDEPADAALLFMADATGHGIGPALSVTQARSMLRMGARVGAPLGRVAADMNRQLCEDLPSGRFITAWFGLLRREDARLLTLSAGQAPLVHYHAATRETEILAADGMPFGITEDFDAGEGREIVLAPGDLFVALSDGFYEAMNHAGEIFGDERICALIRERAAGNAQGLLDAVRVAVKAFSAGLPQADDQTAVIIKREA